MTKVSFPTGYTANMYLGALLKFSSNTPSNHTPFSFLEAEPLQMEEHKNHHLILQLILTQGKGMTVDEITASNEQEVQAPMNFHNIAEQLQMFMVANNIFLDKLSVGSQCRRSLQAMIDQKRSSFKAKECHDKNSRLNFSVQLTHATKFGSNNAGLQQLTATLTTQSSTFIR
jgi:hypothetical protein